MTMSIGLFTNKKHQPTDTEIDEAVGSRLLLWQELICHIRKSYAVQEDFKFLYGKNYGWAQRFRIKGQLLTSLYPTEGGFTAQVNLNPEAIEKAQSMELGENVQQAITCAYPYPEGRWLFVPVESEGDLQDVQRLLELRVNSHPSKAARK
jgi:hypothetical protein